MEHAFVIQPNGFQLFENEEELISQCKEWSLLTDKAYKTKTFYYKGNGLHLSCNIIGYVDKITAVLAFDNNQLHCIHPSYLKEMQAVNYNQKLAGKTEGAEESVSQLENDYKFDGLEPVSIEPGIIESVILEPVILEPADTHLVQDTPEIHEITKSPIDETGKSKEKSIKPPTPKPPKAQKIQLPEEKVKMMATVQEFTTVPNNFSDNDDEVIIYEAVSMVDPLIELGAAWSSHSATIKKLELAIGDTITFEAKIVAKKLTKHPVPYKINNPAKIIKQ